MRTILIPVLFLIVTVCLYSCQKEIDIDLGNPPPSNNDSAWYVSSVHRIDYDTLGVVIDSSAEYYTYLQGKTLYKHISNEFGPLDSFQYTYYYDQNKRLTKFDLDFNTDPFDDDVKTILFTYTGNTAARADITYWNGEVAPNFITYSNGNKTITLYDTVPPFHSWPFITSFYLGTDNRIDSARQIWKEDFPPVYIDTSYIRLNYDAQNNATRYHDNSLFIHPLSSSDSFDSLVVQSRETRGAEIGNTWNKILSNMAWHPALAASSLWNIDIFSDPVAYSRYPIISARRWSRLFVDFISPFDPPRMYVGNFINMFDANNLLTHQELPMGFANKYGGKATLQFTYIKLPQ